ncbi:hypothetical protein QYE76_030385 [Lolium multiflorum]|uniref:Uncharacterized protein n=1 Tax=Lolium multiflorum TaxID=4521 RepID=A0AAD8QQA2_LOLMU|nr:hypothetical protein QYE76_030385 [Lolium multiflorum]
MGGEDAGGADGGMPGAASPGAVSDGGACGPSVTDLGNAGGVEDRGDAGGEEGPAQAQGRRASSNQAVGRLVENGLAVGTELSRRKIKDGIVCLVCNRTEDLVHRFWTCPHTASAWDYLKELAGFGVPAPPKKLRCHAELKGWLLDWIGKTDADQKHASVPAAKPVEHWQPPAEDWVKVNVDGAFRTADGNGGGGVVIRDHHGVFQCGASHFFPMLLTRKGLSF